MNKYGNYINITDADVTNADRPWNDYYSDKINPNKDLNKDPYDLQYQMEKKDHETKILGYKVEELEKRGKEQELEINRRIEENKRLLRLLKEWQEYKEKAEELEEKNAELEKRINKLNKCNRFSLIEVEDD